MAEELSRRMTGSDRLNNPEALKHMGLVQPFKLLELQASFVSAFHFSHRTDACFMLYLPYSLSIEHFTINSVHDK